MQYHAFREIMTLTHTFYIKAIVCTALRSIDEVKHITIQFYQENVMILILGSNLNIQLEKQFTRVPLNICTNH